MKMIHHRLQPKRAAHPSPPLLQMQARTLRLPQAQARVLPLLQIQTRALLLRKLPQAQIRVLRLLRALKPKRTGHHRPLKKIQPAIQESLLRTVQKKLLPEAVSRQALRPPAHRENLLQVPAQKKALLPAQAPQIILHLPCSVMTLSSEILYLIRRHRKAEIQTQNKDNLNKGPKQNDF